MIDRRVAGAVLALFFVVVSVVMAYDLNSMQRSFGGVGAERVQLQLWKIVTLFAGGILATVIAFVFMRLPPK